MENKYRKILRAPHQVSLDITNKCNLRCLHCFNSSGENDVSCDELSNDEILELMKALSKMNLYNVCFCGGEPLLRKELMLESIRILKPSGTHCTAVSNGLLATPDIIKDLECAGLDGIQFSLDGLDSSHDKLRNHKGAYDAVTATINFVLNETNLRLSIAFTPTAFNIKDFPAVYEMLYELFRKSNRFGTSDYIDLRLQPLMLLGRAKQNINIVPTDLQYRELVSYINMLNSTKMLCSSIDIKWGDPIDHLMRFKNTENFLDQISVHANGDIVVSAYLPLVVGNIRKHSIDEYWDNGLNTVWSTDVVQYLVSKMQSIHDMLQITNKIADINMNNGLRIDLIDQDLNDFNLIRDVLLAEI